MTHYDDVIMSKKVRFGSRGSPITAVDQQFFDSGYRATNERWSQYLRMLSLDFRDNPEGIVEEVVRIFNAIGGPAHSFNCRDWTDWNSTAGYMGPNGEDNVTNLDQPLINTVTETALGDGSTTTFQLTKQYAAGSAVHYRDIKKPEASTIVCAVNAVDDPNFTVDQATGIVTFDTAPGNALAVTWGGAFYIPVAFVREQIDISIEQFELQDVLDIELREVRI